jgi:PAS domain S-box-containing protein
LSKKPTYEKLEERIKQLEQAYSELIRTEEELTLEKKRLESLIDYSSLAIVTLDKDHNILSFNSKFGKLFQFKEIDVVGENLDKVISGKEYINDAISYTRETIEGKAIHGFGKRKRKDGTYIDVEFFGVPVIIDGKVTGAYGIYKNLSEQIKAARALRENEERNQTLLETMYDGFGIQDKNGVFTYVNKRLCEMLRYQRDELVGRPAKDFLDKTNQAILKQQLGKRGWSDFNSYELTWTAKDGGKVYTTISPSVILDAKGHVKDFFAVVTDISERKKAEEALMESEQLYRTLIENSLTGIYMIKKGGFIFANENFRTITGYSEEDLKSMDPVDIIHPEHRERIRNRVESRLRGEGVTSEYETEIVRKDGTIRDMLLRAAIVVFEHQPAVLGNLIDITELKRTEKALRESEEKYRTILESIEDGYFEVDIAGNLTFFNDSICKILGYSGDELTGMNSREYTDKKDVKKLYQAFNKVYTTGQPSKAFDWGIIRKDGAKGHVDASISLINDGEDHPIGFRGIVRDITEEKSIEEALRQSEEKYRNILESIEEGYYEVDLKGDFTFFNDSFRKIVGYTKYELLEANYRQYTDPELAKGMYQAFNKVYVSEKPMKGYEWEIISKDGIKRYLEISISLRNDSEGNRIGFGGIVRDVTERKLAEEAFQREKERFRVLVEESPFGVALIGKDGLFKYLNPKFIEIFGYTLEDIPVGKKWFEKAYPDPNYRNQVIATWISDLRKGTVGESRPREFKVICKNGSEKVIGFRPVTMETGDQFVIYEDLTAQKRLETQLLQAQKMESIGTLAGGIAHDFNNILAAILGHTQLADFDLTEGMKAKQNLKEVLKAIQRAKDLVSQIFTFSRKSGLERKPVQISLIVKEALKLLRASLPATIEIRQHIDDNAAIVDADPTQIHQVLMNLCTNASHAMMEKDGVLEVALTTVDFSEHEIASDQDLQPGPYLMLTVRDTGRGMDRKTLERIFDPYFTTKEKGVGTGLGLATTHGIVKSHGGAITVESEPEIGSSFNVYFPVIAREVIPEEDKAKPLPSGHERVLLIDDEQVLVEIGKQMIERLGYKVDTRTSSIEALELFRTKPDQFDLVITDMTMPQMTGDKLAGELMMIRPDIPVILCTGYSDHMTKQKALKMGIKEFAMKPLVIQQLADIIRNVLDEK